MLKTIMLATIIFLAGVQTTVAASIHKVHEGAGDIALVFIHGYSGHPSETFSHSGQNPVKWSDLILSESDVDGFGRHGNSLSIYSVDYTDACDTKISIDDIASQVISHRKFTRVFDDHNHVFFVVHSMGGLVLKRILLQFQQSGQRRYIDRIIGAVFLGVPAEGSDLARYLDKAGGVFAYFSRLVADIFDLSCAQITQLKSHESDNFWISQLQSDWSQLVELRRKSAFPLHIPCAYEAKPEASVFGAEVHVVPRLYASSTCSGPLHPINTSHRNLAKPESSESPIHHWFISQFSSAVKKMRTAEIYVRPGNVDLSDILDAMERERNRVDKITGLKLTDVVAHLKSDKVKALYLKRKKYHAGTYPNLFEKISEDHNCLTVEVDEKRRTVILDIEEERTLVCSGERTIRWICDDMQCPE